MHKESHIVKEFSRSAHDYSKYSLIQRKVADHLISLISDKHYDTIIDIGAGDGEVYRLLEKSKIRHNNFIAFDASENMLKLHPSDSKVSKYLGNFDSKDDLQSLPKHSTVISSSSLQWTKDLEMTLREISLLGTKFYLSVFTSNTFRQIHDFSKVNSPIYSKEDLHEAINKYFDLEISTQIYRLEFSTNRKMLEYIKRSGVSGGQARLSYKESKRLLCYYPYNYLEFEVLFAISK